MFSEKMKLMASLGVWERLEITGPDLEEILLSLGDLDQIEYVQSQRTNIKTGRVTKEVTAIVDYPEKLTEENVQSIADHFGVKIVWRRKVYG